jgi:hypothetical protein
MGAIAAPPRGLGPLVPRTNRLKACSLMVWAIIKSEDDARRQPNHHQNPNHTNLRKVYNDDKSIFPSGVEA